VSGEARCPQRPMHSDVQLSREGRRRGDQELVERLAWAMPVPTAAVEPTGMYLRRVLRPWPGRRPPAPDCISEIIMLTNKRDGGMRF
jgi:hypothetical protein